jgi:hypothetical protein
MQDEAKTGDNIPFDGESAGLSLEGCQLVTLLLL